MVESGVVESEAGWGRKLLPVVALLAALVALMLMLAGTFREKVQPGPLGPDPAPAAGGASAKVVRARFPDVIEQVGTVRSRYRVAVASKLLAEVVELHVEAGDAVQGGAAVASPTLVAVLDSRDLRAELASAEAQERAAEQGIAAQEADVASAEAYRTAVVARVRQAEADFVRVENLVKNGAATQEALDRALAARDTAQADLRAAASRIVASQRQLAQAGEARAVARRQVEKAKVLLSYARLTAPLTGIVVEKKVEVGDTVAPGQTLVLLHDPSALELHAAVAESLAARLKIGQTLRVRVDALGKELSGQVREVAPEADPASRTVTVKLSLPLTPGLVSGLFGRLQIPVGETEALVVPRAAVHQVGQLDLVLVKTTVGKEQRRFVTLGLAHGEQVEVRSGLSEGEEVLLRD
ncbi:MAG: efflux RND transporter periplasmic adaptor subunit [Planctomycetota bacterium]